MFLLLLQFRLKKLIFLPLLLHLQFKLKHKKVLFHHHHLLLQKGKQNKKLIFHLHLFIKKKKLQLKKEIISLQVKDLKRWIDRAKRLQEHQFSMQNYLMFQVKFLERMFQDTLRENSSNKLIFWEQLAQESAKKYITLTSHLLKSIIEIFNPSKYSIFNI